MRLWAFTALPTLLALPLAPNRPLAFITQFLATDEPLATMVEDADSRWFREMFGEGDESARRGHRVYFAEGEMGWGGEVQEGGGVGLVDRQDVMEDEPVLVEEPRLESVESEFRLLLVRLPALVEAAAADISRDLAARSTEGFAIALGYLLSSTLESAADYLLEPDESSHWFSAFLILSSLSDAWPYLFPGVFGAGRAALTCSSSSVYGAVARSGLAAGHAARSEGELAVLGWQLRRDLHLGLACVLDR